MGLKDNSNFHLVIEVRSDDYADLAALLTMAVSSIRAGKMHDSGNYCSGSYTFSITPEKVELSVVVDRSSSDWNAAVTLLGNDSDNEIIGALYKMLKGEK